MGRVVWSDQALDDLEQVYLYLSGFSPPAALRFFIRLRDAGESLSRYPERGRLAQQDMRELTTVKPYIIRYSTRGGRVYITGIRHAARRPQP